MARPKKFGRILFFGLYLLLCLLLLLAYWARFSGQSMLYGLSLLTPLLLVLQLLAILIFALGRSKFFLLPLALIILGFGNWRSWFGAGASDAGGTDWKLLSQNVRVFNKHLGADASKAGLQDFLIMLERENPDVVCLQEFYGSPEFQSVEALKRLGYIHQVFTRSVVKGGRKWGLMTASKFPIKRRNTLKYRERAFAHLIEFEIEDQPILLVNNHLFSNRLNQQDLKDLNELQTSGTKSVAKKLKGAFSSRKVQIQMIQESVEGSGDSSLILCGDFNDPPQTYSYKRLRKINSASGKLKDAHLTRGKGIGATYNGRIPFLRIDYIFHSPKLEPSYFEKLNFKRFDHFPIVCGFRF